jgi:RNA polymerase sigma factor (sigma-70 family)
VTGPNSDETALTELVTAARTGDDRAWEVLVQRYQPLIASTARHFRLRGPDVEDVVQTVWLRVFNKLHNLREPRAMAGWIETATVNVCLTLLKELRRTVPQDLHLYDVADAAPFLERHGEQYDTDEVLIRRENQRAVRRGIAELSHKHQELLSLLAEDPPLSYKQISERLGMPLGSIGPTRARCLEKLRRTDPVRSMLLGVDSGVAA